MPETKHEQQLSTLKTMFCTCGILSINAKYHDKWCPFWAAFKDLKPQPKKYQEPAEKR